MQALGAAQQARHHTPLRRPAAQGRRRARLGRRWLEGRIARSLGCPAEAERAFEEVWPAFSERRLQFKLTCLSLDLAEVYLERGKRQQVLPLVSGRLAGRPARPAELI